MDCVSFGLMCQRLLLASQNNISEALNKQSLFISYIVCLIAGSFLSDLFRIFFFRAMTLGRMKRKGFTNFLVKNCHFGKSYINKTVCIYIYWSKDFCKQEVDEDGFNVNQLLGRTVVLNVQAGNLSQEEEVLHQEEEVLH